MNPGREIAMVRLESPRRSLIQFLCIMTLCCWACTASGLDPRRAPTQYSMSQWKQRQGLPQNSVMDIVQTPDGFIWLATQEGVVRFDGVDFDVWNTHNTPELPGHHALSASVCEHGGVWFALMRGGLVSFHGRQIENTVVEGEGHTYQPQVVCSDAQGRVWIGTRDDGVSVYANGRLQRVDSSNATLDKGSINDILTRDDGSVWVASDHGVHMVTGEGITSYTVAAGLPDDRVTCLAEASDGSLWIGTRGGLTSWNGVDFVAAISGGATIDMPIKDLLEDSHGSLWIAGITGGLNRLSDGKLAGFRDGDDLSIAMIESLYEDLEGSLWIGTSGSGLYRLNDGAFTALTRREGLKANKVTSVFQQSDGTFWVGTEQGLHRVKDGVHYIGRDEGLSANYTTAMFEDTDGSVWVGTYTGGLNRIDDRGIHLPDKVLALPSVLVRSIVRDADGTLWVGTENGLLRSGPDGERIYTRDDGLPDNRVRALAAAADGTIWAGTDAGLVRIVDGEIDPDLGRGDLCHEMILTMCTDADGALWAGTLGSGLKRIKNGGLSSITSADGLYDDSVFALVIDDHDDLWASCNRGVFRVSRHDLNALADGDQPSLECTPFGTADGMPSAECNGGYQSTGCLDNHGNVWFATVDGAVSIDPRRVTTNDVAPPVQVTRVIYDNRDIALLEQDHLPAGRGDISFEYTALSFLTPEQITFQYQLEGFDDAWIDAGTRRQAFYTKLPPGNYTFRVRARNASGVWNEVDAVYAFHKLPHYYETAAFRAAVGLVLFLVVIGAVSLRIRQAKKREQLLRRLVDERTGQLQLAQQELVEKAHKAGMADIAAGVLHNIGNILNSVNTSSGQVADMLNETRLTGLDKANTLLASELSAAELPAESKLTKLGDYYQQLTGKLWDENHAIMKEVRRQLEQIHVVNEVIHAQQHYAVSDMNSELLTPVSVVQDALTINGGSIKRHGIDLFTEFDDVPPVSLQKVKLIHVLVNLFKNAKEAMLEADSMDKILRIEVSNDETTAYIKVIDTGPGIPTENLERIFNSGFTTKKSGHGFGLHSCANYMTEMDGRLRVESEGEGRGATFIIELPLAQDTAVSNAAEPATETTPEPLVMV